ncbi:mechanosensitive ion channel family protein [Thalassotalea mangrovi]|uniref:Mechanosensitive ion channel family protein n=1 Tax=Thalassotalea mangrovi TaxID=2572245 RepID=A0A4U1B9Z4_9GAMM|nr:mechanosensitive ion channel family protein [Thalassotalea mangrovi]TKB47484.1 mechanosensitive ion channel family protein [Thalassotalea mangrovi]
MYLKLMITALVIILSFLLKQVIIRLLKSKASKTGVDHRHTLNTVRNIVNLLVVIAVFIVWSAELQKFAISIAAFVVAIVLVTKEIIQCFIGFIYMQSTAPFRIGDWIKIGDFTGEVSETDWAKVILLEVDINTYEYTGKSVFIPNNQFMTLPLKNLNFMRRYVNHTFSIVREANHINPFVLKQPLLDKALSYCHPFNDVAERYNALIENRLEVKISGPAPSVTITTTELGKVKVTFSVFCPTHEAFVIEQKLTNDMLQLWHDVSHANDTNTVAGKSA